MLQSRFKERKRRIPISPLADKARLVAKVLHRLVFHNKCSPRIQQLLLSHYCRDFRNSVKVIRRIGKNKIKLFGLILQVFKNIFSKYFYRSKLMLPCGISHKSCTMYTSVDRNNAGSAARSKLQRNIACAAK